MIPRLFSENATTFNNFGICPLVDCISCSVTQERNNEFILDLTYPRDGRWATEITGGRIILAMPEDDATEAEPFRIASVDFDMNENITVHAEHLSYDLGKIIIGANQQDPGTRYPAKFWEVENRYLLSASNPFTFTTDISDDNGTVYKYGTPTAVSLKSLLGGNEGSMLDLYGGEFRWNRYNVQLLAARGSNNGVKIAYTKNLTGLKHRIDMSDTFTGVIAYWSSGDDYVESSRRTASSGLTYSRDIAVDASQDFTEKPTVAQLNTWADKYIQRNNNGKPGISIDVEFVPLWQTEEYKRFYNLEHVKLCDTVTIIYPPLNIEVEAKVVKTVYNVLADRYDSIVISSIRADLADTIYSLMKELS